MKAVIQRVKGASVKVGTDIVGEISDGYLVLLGVMKGDTEEEMQLLAKKTVELRIFSDENDKMNLSIKDIDGEILVVSQFTLCADVTHGRRPSFTPSAAANEANDLYEKFVSQLKSLGIKKVATGKFGADMKVELINDGPVTIIFNTDEWIKKGDKK